LLYSKNILDVGTLYAPLSSEALKMYKMNNDKGAYRDKDFAWKNSSKNLNQIYEITAPDGEIIKPKNGYILRFIKSRFEEELKKGNVTFKKTNTNPFVKRNGEQSNWNVYIKKYLGDGTSAPTSVLPRSLVGLNNDGTVEIQNIFGERFFEFPKSVRLMQYLINIGADEDSIILDFFAGSGTTGHAVMQLNAEDGGNRKFILCQEDREIDKDKPAYKFCVENNLPPVISSITIERLKRAGEKIKKEIEAENSKSGMFDEHKRQVPDIGFKVFDTVEAPKLEADEKGQISIRFNDCDALSRIYNMIFTVGLDEPTQVPEEVVKDCIYKIGNHYYITNSEKYEANNENETYKVFQNLIGLNNKIFIDGWTASLNGTLMSYKEDVKIVF
jgi:adenine-specific DNA-methyltransferase